MRISKRILNIFLILLLVFSLMACGKKTEDEADNKETETTVDTESSDNVSTIKLTDKTEDETKPIESDSESTDTDETEPAKTVANDFDYEEEPDSPIAEINLSQAEQGVSEREAKRFFKTFSTIPVYYEYKSTTLPENKTQTVTISIDEIGRTYTKIESEQDSVEIISTADEKYYELDRENKVANRISKEIAQGEIISKDVFEQIYAQAELLYYVGKGKGQFSSHELEFEEYTKDNKTFVRYYFDDESIYGHRTFENNQLKSQVAIKALKNYFPDEMEKFLIPEDFTINEESND